MHQMMSNEKRSSEMKPMKEVSHPVRLKAKSSFLTSVTIIGQLMLAGNLSAASLPNGTFLYEAEEFFMNDGRFQIKDCIHTSATRFIGARDKQVVSSDECLLFQGDFPGSNSSYTVWACVRNLDIEVRSAILNPVKFKGQGKEWHWISLGRYTTRQIGTTFALYGLPTGKGFAPDTGIDAVILVSDAAFIPCGVFQGYSGREDTATSPTSQQSTAQAEYMIRNLNPGLEISPFIASANAHGLAPHMPDHKDWDKLMLRFYGNNMLAPLFKTKTVQEEGEPAWDFESIDKFLKRAREQWQVREIMMFPQWTVKGKDGAPPTREQLDSGVRLLMQLVERYGTKKNPLYVRYWVLSDEWPCGGYWKKNYKEFAEYYARLVKEVKKFNPELIVGGPVDCWPNDTITAELLKICPELDFIAWNMFITGRADTPLASIFQRTSLIKTFLRSSRELGRRWHKKDVPVFITSLGPNYHAWDPQDLRLAEPVMGVWHALAINYMAEEGCTAGLFYNVRARDCGFFGPNDQLSQKSGMQPADMNPQTVNLRPSGRIVEFYKKYLAGKKLLPVAAVSPADKFNLIAAAADNGKTLISAVNFAEVPRQVKIRFESFKMKDYGCESLPDDFIYCDRQNITSGKGFFFHANGTAELWMPPYSAWVIMVDNHVNPQRLKLAEEMKKRYSDLVAVFHMDGSLEDSAGSGSKSMGWFGEHFSRTHFKCGYGAGDYTGNLCNRARIRLEGRAASLNGSKTFGIAFWVYRVKNTSDYGSVLSFGKDKFMIEHVGGGNPDPRFQLKNPGFCDFGGTWKHSLLIPANEWTHVAITADGEYGRIVVNGQTKWKFPQTDMGLNGSDILYLGSQHGDAGPIDCYIDELILSNKPTSENWAKDIYEHTKNGKNYE